MKDDPPKESTKWIRKSIDMVTANFCAMKKKIRYLDKKQQFIPRKKLFKIICTKTH